MIDNKSLQEIEADYMESLAKVEVLEDVMEHIEQIRQGNRELYKLLLNTYMVRIPSIVEKFVDDSLDIAYMDLIQEGNYALLEKTQYYFDNKLKEDFDRYIITCIENQVQDFIKEQNTYISLPTEDVENLIKVVHTIEDLQKKLKREPSFDEIKEKLKDMDETQLRLYLELKNS